MSSKELIESLRKVCDEKTRSIWKEAEAEAEKIRAEVARKLDRLREETARIEAVGATEKIAQAVSEANNEARRLRLSVEKALSDRLFSFAASSLSRLRNERYPHVFETLARELPPLLWQSVRVNPEDIDLAKKYFPAAEIIPDKTIVGGMDAMTDAGKVRVINTFEKRLERAWVEDMLPGLIEDCYEEMSGHGTPRVSGEQRVSY